MRILYSIGIYIYAAMIRVATLFMPKAALAIRGRKHWQSRLQEAICASDLPVIWMHCSSLGEYEQGKPLLLGLRKQYPRYRLLLTFFSPSGYEIRKDNAVADMVFYLPMDTPSNAKIFIKIVQPSLAVFVKYEFWYNYLKQLSNNEVPTVFISAIFRSQQYFFKWYGTWFRKHLQAVQHVFVQNENSLQLLKSIGINTVSKAGDTRFDSVAAIAQQQKETPVIQKFKGAHKLLLAGSTWPIDEQYLLEVAKAFPDFKLLIAPHEIHDSHIKEIQKLFQDMRVTLYTQVAEDTIANSQVLILDTMGMLSSLYRYADYTWIGGGFGKGIHNTLEAAVFGMPIFFGPKYDKFDEAKALVRHGIAKSLTNAQEAIEHIQSLESDNKSYKRIKTAAQTYVQNNLGSVDIILKHLQDYLES